MKKTLAWMVTVILMAGCVPSWNPLYTEKDLTFDPALVGVWNEDDSKETWAFSKEGDQKYKLVHTDNDGQPAEFEVRLVKLENYRFLDLYLTKVGAGDAKMNGLASCSLLPAHLFLRVVQIEPALKMAAMDPEWLQKFLEKNPKALKHEKTGQDRIVLTASTKEIQEFILKNVDKQGLFGEPSDLKRKTAALPSK